MNPLKSDLSSGRNLSLQICPFDASKS